MYARHRFVPSGLGPLEKAEIRLGRQNWSRADYFAEGRREALAAGYRADVDHYAHCFVQMHCPRGKRSGSAG